MAYLRDLDRKCSYPGCDKRATVELRSWRNETIAPFCRPHGERARKNQQAMEDEGR
jgi:hypothetical protein